MGSVTAKLIHFTPDYLDVIAGAMSKCYERKVGANGVLKAIDAGHLSILEHAYATFDIMCSLAVLGQLTRHRHLSFTVMSTRGANPKGVIVPEKFRGDDEVYNKYMDIIEDAFRGYGALLQMGVALEDAAYVLPKGTKTKLRVTGNFRAWFEYLSKRLCKRAMPEHRELAQLILNELKMAISLFDRDFMNCTNCTEHGCSFH